MFSRFAVAVALQTIVLSVSGVLNDWVKVEYVIRNSSSENSRSNTADARNTIMRLAESSSRATWSVTNERSALPPSGNSHDYLSWAPYHWPDCNWCPTSDGTHSVRSNGEVNNTFPDNDNNSLRSLASEEVGLPQTPLGVPLPLPTLPLSDLIPSPSTHDPPSQTTDSPVDNTHRPAQAVAKTSKTTCTPSPTHSLSPSATWTTCPYVVHDGRVNPDVQSLNGPGAINGLSETAIYNAIAYAISDSTVYSRNFARFIDTFFLNESTRMYPNMNYGQIVRGPLPGGSLGTFTGILDLRGLVKVINGILIMQGKQSQDWTSAREQSMNAWVKQYIEWLAGSSLGKEAASRPNNHASFYFSQVVAAKIYIGDRIGAAAALKTYFTSQFLDQIAKSGEQPFEALRTRPFHYRCFGLEAMITNAKLGDQLGVNYWTARSRYGATIQTAVDYTMSIDPKSEDVREIVPHVAAIAAVYGDPTGRYARFMGKMIANYQAMPFFFYDQPTAFPASTMNEQAEIADNHSSIDPFDCMKVLDGTSVELDNGVFATCKDLEPLFQSS